MIREMVVLLAILAVLAVPIQAKAEHSSGDCYIEIFIGNDIRYSGTGEWKQVTTPSENTNFVCQGILDPTSDIPDKAMNIEVVDGRLLIAPGGHFTWIEKNSSEG